MSIFLQSKRKNQAMKFSSSISLAVTGRILNKNQLVCILACYIKQLDC